jgi:polyvinyl alcohol dehydrogenase (cytochrome)
MKTIILLACVVLTYAHVYQSNYGLGNTRYATDSAITTANIGTLKESWRFTTAGDVMGQATTATVGGIDVTFFADAAGWIYSVSLATGGLIWKKHSSDITGIASSYSRNAPAFYNNRIYLGDQKSGYFWCLDATNGALVWRTLLDTNVNAIVTQSATVDEGNVFVGCSSNDVGSPVITFRGSLSRLDADTGAVIWKAYMTPQGYTGVGVWGSSPAIDYSRNTVYCTTGNNYELPASVLNCINSGGGKECMAKNNYVDSIVALNIDTGAVRWATNFNGIDWWNLHVCTDESNCAPLNKDFDFAQGPMLFKVNGVDAVGAGQKGGLVHAVNRDNGNPIWTTKLGEGTSGGGMLHGSTVDDKYIYVGNTNNWGQPWTLVDGSVCEGFQGYWSAIDKNTGSIVWQKCNPTGYRAYGPLTSVPGGLMFAASIDPAGAAYAFRASDGAIVWQTELGGSVGSGAALTGNYLIWGSGYSKWGVSCYFS